MPQVHDAALGKRSGRKGDTYYAKGRRSLLRVALRPVTSDNWGMRFKTWVILAGVTLATGAAIACASQPPTPTPEPTATPTATPAPEPTPTPRPSPTRTPTPVASVTDSVQHYAVAYALLSRGEWVEAERRFSVVIELEPNFARAWDGRGQARLNKGDYRGALTDFDRAIELKPDLAKAYANRAMTRYAIDDNKGSEADALKALELDPADPRGYIVLGRLAGDAGLLSAAADYFDRAVEIAPDRGDVFWWRGRFLSAAGEYAAALDDLTIAVELAPSIAGAWLDRGLTILRMADGGLADPRLAKPDLEEAKARAQIEPKNPAVEQEAIRQLKRIEDFEKQAGASLPPLTTPQPGNQSAPTTPTPESTAQPTPSK
ncbi:MAG: tetratricopeptide repeat protein [Chloroflexi bacterium]|nr:tetratricopeptide repeat protein [Chloroflexota bacterium]